MISLQSPENDNHGENLPKVSGDIRGSSRFEEISARERFRSHCAVVLTGFIEPALATAIERVPAGERWVHEIKFDGYRVQTHIKNTDIRIFIRRGHDWTAHFRKITTDAWHINVQDAIIDGEVVVPSAQGSTDFAVLQNELKRNSKRSSWWPWH